MQIEITIEKTINENLKQQTQIYERELQTKTNAYLEIYESRIQKEYQITDLNSKVAKLETEIKKLVSFF